MANETKPEAPPKSRTVTLADPAGTVLRIIAERRRDGAVTFAVHTVGKKNSRGVTERHATWEGATIHQDKLAARAVKDGWVQRQQAGGFARKADAFTELPKPATKPSKKAAA